MTAQQRNRRILMLISIILILVIVWICFMFLCDPNQREGFFATIISIILISFFMGSLKIVKDS